jgi:hypothetical protein
MNMNAAKVLPSRALLFRIRPAGDLPNKRC